MEYKVMNDISTYFLSLLTNSFSVPAVVSA